MHGSCNAEQAIGGEHQRVSVGCAPYNLSGRNQVVRPRLIDHSNNLAQSLTQVLRHQAGHYVGGSTGRERHDQPHWARSEEHTSELQSLMRTSYAVFCLKKKKTKPESTT